MQSRSRSVRAMTALALLRVHRGALFNGAAPGRQSFPVGRDRGVSRLDFRVARSRAKPVGRPLREGRHTRGENNQWGQTPCATLSHGVWLPLVVVVMNFALSA